MHAVPRHPRVKVLLCGKCKRWWHLKCDNRPPATKNYVNSSKRQCQECSKSGDVNLGANDTNDDVTRVNITDTHLLGGDEPEPCVEGNSTIKPFVKTKARTINSRASKEPKLAKRELELEQ